MLRANLQAARTHADSSGDEGAELHKLRSDLSKATRQISELEETAVLFKDQQSASVQAAATLQAEVLFSWVPLPPGKVVNKTYLLIRFVAN